MREIRKSRNEAKIDEKNSRGNFKPSGKFQYKKSFYPPKKTNKPIQK